VTIFSGCRDGTYASRGGVGELARRLQLHGRVGDHELQALEVGDRPAELLALPDVASA
jgi:hypothetical protein